MYFQSLTETCLWRGRDKRTETRGLILRELFGTINHIEEEAQAAMGLAQVLDAVEADSSYRKWMSGRSVGACSFV
jgi:hypothetical protein